MSQHHLVEDLATSHADERVVHRLGRADLGLLASSSPGRRHRGRSLELRRRLGASVCVSVAYYRGDGAMGTDATKADITRPSHISTYGASTACAGCVLEMLR